MGSKGRMPPPHLRRPLPDPGILYPDPFGPGIHAPPGAFPPFEMMPPPEVMEQKIAAQHGEMQRLATENQRLGATHGTLRQELAAAQHELQILQAHIGAVKSEREQQMRSLMEKIAKVEAELQAVEPVKLELQQARKDLQNLIAVRQELIMKVQQLTQDLQRAHSDVQQIPALMSELESLRQEYHHCRATYDYEKKLYNDHLESLQVMEKNFLTMAREVEKLQAELTNTTNVDRRIGGPYGATAGYNDNEASGNHPVIQNSYEDSYSVPQGRGPVPVASSGATVTGTPLASAPAYVGGQSGPAPVGAGYDASRYLGYDPQRGPGYDAQRVFNYNAQRGPGYDAQAPWHDGQKGPAHDAQRGHGYDVQRGYDAQRGPGYDASKGSVGAHGQVPPANNVPYGSATPPAHAGSGYEAPPRGGNPGRR